MDRKPMAETEMLLTGQAPKSPRYESSPTLLSMSPGHSCKLYCFIQTQTQQGNHQAKEHVYLETVSAHRFKIPYLRKVVSFFIIIIFPECQTCLKVNYNFFFYQSPSKIPWQRTECHQQLEEHLSPLVPSPHCPHRDHQDIPSRDLGSS